MYIFKFMRRNFVEKAETAGASTTNASATQTEANQQSSATTENASGDAQGQQQQQQPGAEEKRFTQAELDAKINERLARERESTKQKQEKEKADAERAELAKKQEYKELSEKQEADLKTLTTEKETLTAKVTALEEELNQYKTHFQTQLTEQKKALPEPVQKLLDGLTPIQQAAWIAENAAKLGVKGVPPSPRGDGGGTGDAVDDYITSLNGKGQEKK